MFIMIKIIKSLLIVLFLASFSLQAHSETSWITKKSDKSKSEIKLEKKEKKAELKKEKSEWIKKKKITKNEYKKEKKLISKEEKNWIKKKNKNQPLQKVDYILEAKFLPKSDYYFKINNLEKNQYYYGYLNLVGGEIINADGYTFIKDNETGKGIVCNITGAYTGNNKIKIRINSDCTDKTKNFTGTIYSSNTSYADDGRLKSNNGENLLIDFFLKKNTLVASIPKQRYPGPLSIPPENKIEPEGKYYALIIANSNYNNKEIWSDLKSPSRDAIAIKEILDKKYEFTDSWLIEDASRIEIHEEFKKLKDIVTDKDYLLIYYVGHGAEVNGNPYWVPVEGGENYFEWVNVNSLTNSLSNIKARDILIMIDSCYSGLSFQTKSSNKKDINNSSAAIKDALINYSRKVLTSGHNEKVEDTYYDKEHSLFALGFIKILTENESNVTAESIYFDIKKLHQLDENIPQVPKYGTINNLKLTLKDMAKGEFVFHVPNNNE